MLVHAFACSKAIKKIQKSVKKLFSFFFFIFLRKPLVSLRLLMEIHNTRVLSMRMGQIFLFLISINFSTCYAHKGIKYHFPTFSIFFKIQRKHSKYYRIGTPFSNRLIERGLQAATKIFLNQNHKLRYRHMSKVVSLSSLGGLMGL